MPRNGNTECRAGSQRTHITSSREDRHVTRMVLMDRATSSRALSQNSGRLQDNKCLTNSLTTFAATWTLSTKNMAVVTLDAASHT
ncbi:hypothetical protein TNCV_1031951 [Trichonephila clavipes]|nr:hypothetical protein TNCV_1031951 [Trichonephila clavipes]